MYLNSKLAVFFVPIIHHEPVKLFPIRQFCFEVFCCISSSDAPDAFPSLTINVRIFIPLFLPRFVKFALEFFLHFCMWSAPTKTWTSHTITCPIYYFGEIIIVAHHIYLSFLIWCSEWDSNPLSVLPPSDWKSDDPPISRPERCFRLGVFPIRFVLVL